ncbi:MAG: hypothetical protein C0478_18315, partial [Planctomyces sp.]|nr:hypothetical protein [Planctomyces sp.]
MVDLPADLWSMLLSVPAVVRIRGGRMVGRWNLASRAMGWGILIFGMFCAATDLAPAADWPQFRGPTGEGLSTEAVLPLEWSEEK